MSKQVSKKGNNTVDEIMVLMQSNKPSDVDVVWNLRRYKINRFGARTVRVTKAVLTLDAFGVPLVTRLVSKMSEGEVVDINYGSTIAALHLLGDKHVLILKRHKSGYLEYLMHPAFKVHFTKYYKKIAELVKGEGDS